MSSKPPWRASTRFPRRADTGETAPGLPIDVVMKAGKISHVGCTVSLQTITGATKGPAPPPQPSASPSRWLARSPVWWMRDDSQRHRLEREPPPPRTAPRTTPPIARSTWWTFVEVARSPRRPSSRWVVHRRRLRRRHPVCAPSRLHVYLSLRDAAASIRGDALSGVLRGAPSLVLVQTEDKFGNIHGGETRSGAAGSDGARAKALTGGPRRRYVRVHARRSRRGTMGDGAAVNGRVAKESGRWR